MDNIIKEKYVAPLGWREVFPESPLNWKVYDIKDKDGNILRGSRRIYFIDGIGHCLIKI